MILLRGIRRSIAADRALNDDQSPISAQVEPVFGILGDSLPEPLAFVSEKPLSVSDVSETPGFGGERNIQEGGRSCARKRKMDIAALLARGVIRVAVLSTLASRPKKGSINSTTRSIPNAMLARLTSAARPMRAGTYFAVH